MASSANVGPRIQDPVVRAALATLREEADAKVAAHVTLVDAAATLPSVNARINQLVSVLVAGGIILP